MTRLVGGIVGLLVLVYVVREVVRGRIRVRYAALWLLVSAIVLLVAVVPGLLGGLAGLLGFAVPANMLFFAGVTFLLVVGISHSAAITSLEDRVQRLAEEVSLLAEARSRDEPVGRAADTRDSAGGASAAGDSAAGASAAGGSAAAGPGRRTDG